MSSFTSNVEEHQVNAQIHTHGEASSYMAAQSSEAVDSRSEEASLPYSSTNLDDDWLQFVDFTSLEDLESLSTAEGLPHSQDYAELHGNFLDDGDQLASGGSSQDGSLNVEASSPLPGSTQSSHTDVQSVSPNPSHVSESCRGEAIQDGSLNVEASSPSPGSTQSSHTDVQSVSPDPSHVSDSYHNDEGPTLNATDGVDGDLQESEEITSQQEPNYDSQTDVESSQVGSEYHGYNELTQEEILYFFSQRELQELQTAANSREFHNAVERHEEHNFDEQPAQQYYNLEREQEPQQNRSSSSRAQINRSSSRAQINSSTFASREVIIIDDDDEPASDEDNQATGPITIEDQILKMQSIIATWRAEAAANLARIAKNKKTLRRMEALEKRRRSGDDSTEDEEDDVVPVKKRKPETYRRPSTEKKPKGQAQASKRKA